MTKFKEMLEIEEKRLTNIVKNVKEQLKDAPEGSLRITKCKKWIQFYHKTSETKKNGIYIPKSNMELVRQLAQKEYAEKVLKLVEKRLVQIQRLCKEYKDNEIEQLYQNEHPVRQSLITPVEPTWEQMLEQWKLKKYVKKGFSEDVPVILTEKGMRVRSKSEKIISDYLDKHEIVYKYESPLYLKGMGTVYPDFTYLSKGKRCEVYHEHFGKMDDPSYCNQAIRKIHAYEANGIFIGDRLIVTLETTQNVLNTREFERVLKKQVLE